MLAEQPEITWAGDRDSRRLRGLLLARVGRVAVEQRVELAVVEAEAAEVEAEVLQLAELQRQQLGVPAGVEREPVVGEDVRALLRLGEVGEFDDGDGVEA